jgi:hypothetical protein
MLLDDTPVPKSIDRGFRPIAFNAREDRSRIDRWLCGSLCTNRHYDNRGKHRSQLKH